MQLTPVDWADIWRMLFNIVKCHHLHIGKHDSGTTYTMKSKDQEIEIEKVNNEEDLGVIIDQKSRSNFSRPHNS